jgi:hypothetical protein
MLKEYNVSLMRPLEQVKLSEDHNLNHATWISSYHLGSRKQQHQAVCMSNCFIIYRHIFCRDWLSPNWRQQEVYLMAAQP